MANHYIVRHTQTASDAMAAPDVQDTSLSRVQRDIGADGDLLPWYQVLKPKPHERRHNYLRRYVYRGVDELRRQQKCEEETPTPPQILDRMI